MIHFLMGFWYEVLSVIMCAHFGDSSFLTELIYMANYHMQHLWASSVWRGQDMDREKSPGTKQKIPKLCSFITEQSEAYFR